MLAWCKQTTKVVSCVAALLFIILVYRGTNKARKDTKPGFCLPKRDCCNLSSGSSVKELCDSINVKTIMNCTCTDFMYCHLVTVTAISSNHFVEANAMIGSIQTFLPDNKIIVFDLGLTASENSELSAYCNVEVRSFKFEDYPEHVSDLRTYAWKPLIVEEVSREYEVILYADSSIRMKGSVICSALQSLKKFPFFSGAPHYHAIISLTHDGMIKYLQYPESRNEMAEIDGVEANCWLLWANSLMRRKLLHPWTDCALNKDCIAPSGASVNGCTYITLFLHKDGRYIGCHRYDQSALNLILAREFGPHIWNSVVNKTVSKSLWEIRRYATHNYIAKKCYF